MDRHRCRRVLIARFRQVRLTASKGMLASPNDESLVTAISVSSRFGFDPKVGRTSNPLTEESRPQRSTSFPCRGGARPDALGWTPSTRPRAQTPPSRRAAAWWCSWPGLPALYVSPPCGTYRRTRKEPRWLDRLPWWTDPTLTPSPSPVRGGSSAPRAGIISATRKTGGPMGSTPAHEPE